MAKQVFNMYTLDGIKQTVGKYINLLGRGFYYHKVQDDYCISDMETGYRITTAATLKEAKSLAIHQIELLGFKSRVSSAKRNVRKNGYKLPLNKL
jgi:hypothetical protein